MQTEPDLAQLPTLTRWKRALVALGRVMRDPEQTEQVLVFNSHINAGTLARRIDRFMEDPAGQKMYAEQRRIDSHTIDLDALLALPEGTLGHAYARFLRDRGLTPEVFDEPPHGVSDPRAAYVIQRLRQTHDLWHVVTGFDTDAASEIALQAFTFAQTGSPGAGILAAAGTVRGTRGKPRLALDVLAAYRMGKRAERFTTFAWEDHWATPLAEVRAMLGVAAA
jgi:ubiquinone biosynthesis protein COQ4